MVDLGEIQTVYYMIAATGVLVAAIYYVLNMRATLQTRQAQLFMNIYQTTYSQFFQDAQYKTYSIELNSLDDYKKMTEDGDKYKAFYIYGGFFEGVGVLVREKLVDVSLVAKLMSGITLGWWEKYKHHVEINRKEYGFPRYMVETEYLAKSISDYGKKHPELGIAIPK